MKQISIFSPSLLATICAFCSMVHFADAAAVDSDGDGVNNYREQKDGTNPNDANSFNPLSQGLLAYYPFNNGLLDESGYTKDLDQTANYELVADLTRGNGQALRSPTRTNGGVMSSSVSGVSENAPRTISFWFKSDGPQPWPAGNIVLLGSRVRIDSGRGSIQIDNGYRDVETPPIANLHGRTRHFVWTYANKLGDSKFYLDGEPVGLIFTYGDANTTLDGVPDGPIKVAGGPGASGFGDRGFQGNVDNIRLYDRALSAVEVSALYNAERPVYEVTLTLKSSTNMVIWTHVLTNTIETFNAQEFYKKDISVRLKP